MARSRIGCKRKLRFEMLEARRLLAGLLMNGSFESGPDIPSYNYLPLDAGSTVIPGWTVTAGQSHLNSVESCENRLEHFVIPAGLKTLPANTAF